jgi:hypothetical protein
MKNINLGNNSGIINSLLNRLDILRPSVEEMLTEISRSGLSINLENVDAKFIERHKLEVITSMWKIVKVAKMVDEQVINVNLSEDHGHVKSRNNPVN